MKHLSYRHFAHVCSHSCPDDEVIKNYLEYISSSFTDRTLKLNKNFCLWRAQVETGTYEHEIHGKVLAPCDKKRLIPDASKVCEGRANPKGTAYLYTATKEETAVHEVRPWIGSHISLGLFSVSKDMKIINCSEFQGRSEHEPLLRNISITANEGWEFRELSKEQLLEKEWIHIDNAFSQPVSINKNISDYKPTQKIAGFIQQKGYDGIAYKSVFANGYNIVLFDINSVTLCTRSLIEVKKLQISYTNIGDTY